MCSRYIFILLFVLACCKSIVLYMPLWKISCSLKLIINYKKNKNKNIASGLSMDCNLIHNWSFMAQLFISIVLMYQDFDL